jgi:hypothetical protein
MPPEVSHLKIQWLPEVTVSNHVKQNIVMKNVYGTPKELD